MNKNSLKGVFAPITTPFDHNQGILLDKIISNIEKYNQTSLRGYMPLGSNGEFQGLTDDESVQILKTVCKYKSKDKTIVAGCGRESAYKTVEFIKKISDCGLDFAFILPPHYFVNKMNDEALELYYTYIADRSPVPIIIYNAPKFASGILISESLISTLSKHPNIVAMKNSSMHPTASYMRAIEPDQEFFLIAGNIKTFYEGLCHGAIGGVLSTATYMPEYCCELYDHYVNGRLKEAFDIHLFLNKLSSETIGLHGVAGVKLGMDIRGLYGGKVRLPLLSAPEHEVQRITRYFKDANIPSFPKT
jgi:4-hydroxy-2-oxoglutarate aldolase